MTINKNVARAENSFQLSQKIIIFFVVFLAFPLFFLSKSIFTAFSQTNDRKEIKKLVFDNEPVEFAALQVGGKNLQVDESFTQSEDWLKDFAIEFKNKTNKTIVYFEIGLDFPETIETGNIMSFPVKYGVHPRAAVQTFEDTPVKPGETVRLSLSKKRYDYLQSFLKPRQPLNTLSKVEVRISFILFDDGTAWAAGEMLRPDPNKPSEFVIIKENK